MAEKIIRSSEDPRIKRFPRPTKYGLDYSKMEIGDIWGTVSNSPVAIAIKIRTWGLRKAFSLRHCNHIAVTVKIQDQFFLVEALSDGIRLSSCYAYLNPTLRNFGQRVCWIGRYELMTAQMRKTLNLQAICMATDYPKYDYSGVLSYGLPYFFRQKDKRFYCSEKSG